MKNFKKGFTLVEMLIVVVIIGILAAAILPRLNGVQAAARDTARETALRDIAMALEMYANSTGKFPVHMESNTETNPTTTDKLTTTLITERDYLKSMPTEPRKNTTFNMNGNLAITNGNFGYLLIKRNGQAKQAFVLAAAVETADKANATSAMVESYTQETEINDLKLCSSVKLVANGTTSVAPDASNNNECIVKNLNELRLVIAR